MFALTRPRRTALLAFTLLLAGCGGSEDAPAEDASTEAAPPDPMAPITIANAGLETPESVLHDPDADVYLVSNIAGDPLGKDDNGFISRFRPSGEVETLRWIDGAAPEVTLNAPKGLAIVGDTLFVADIDSVRAFDRTTGQSLGARGVPGASFLNDLAAGPDGTLYVTDSGLGEGFAPTGADAVYRFGPRGLVRLASGESLARPNGIAASAGDLFMVPFGGNSIVRLPPGGGEPSTVVELPAGQLDGVIWVTDGVFLVSSWESSTVYLVTAGSVQPVLENVESPADIGWDSGRRRVLIPVFNGNRIEIRHVP